MQVQVKLGEPLWRSVGARKLVLDWPPGVQVRVSDVLARLTSEYPAFPIALSGQGLVRRNPYHFFIDAAPLGTGSAETELRDGQTLYIVLPAAGG